MCKNNNLYPGFSIQDILDKGRTAEIEYFGIKVIRFTNEEVLENISTVLDAIASQLTTPHTPQIPASISLNLQ
ncbi:MAG: endonuclease domain-containing protein [Bacteroidales bacterium]|nr:endonuclease domain-containing protein [Bacteroidales bacterium]MCF8392064.1 endonuclease domain-containing protein [Bacteroidales bacterium]